MHVPFERRTEVSARAIERASSDPTAAKPANEAARAAEEQVEPRGAIKENADQQTTVRTQSREVVRAMVRPNRSTLYPCLRRFFFWERAWLCMSNEFGLSSRGARGSETSASARFFSSPSERVSADINAPR